MKASEYAAAINALIAEHGDLEVKQETNSGAHSMPLPKVGFTAQLSNGEQSPWFWETCMDDAQRGEKVIRV